MTRPIPIPEWRLIRRFWQSACGFWKGASAWRVWLLTVLLFIAVILQLLIQFWLNYWNRDFFNAIQQRDTVAVWTQAKIFFPLVGCSIAVAMFSIWGRMTMQRKWRQWLSQHLFDYWLGDGQFRRLVMSKEAQTPEYRIAEDARIATEAPVDLVLGLFTSLITATTFIGVLWTIGDVLPVNAFGLTLAIPRYLVVAVVVYSVLLAATTIVVGRHFEGIIEGKNQAEAQLRSIGAHLRETSEGTALPDGKTDGRRQVARALDEVIARWLEICWQFVRLTFISQMNLILTPVIALLLCMPRYLEGSMSLGEVVQAAAAFVMVQGAFNWVQDNFGRLADWTSSANRVAFLLLGLDQINGQSDGGVAAKSPPVVSLHR
jgi:vitamin B12/bleomycin/antimicrobial peptide transport system ATP-binding/permease protein